MLSVSLLLCAGKSSKSAASNSPPWVDGHVLKTQVSCLTTAACMAISIPGRLLTRLMSS